MNRIKQDNHIFLAGLSFGLGSSFLLILIMAYGDLLTNRHLIESSIFGWVAFWLIGLYCNDIANKCNTSDEMADNAAAE